MPYRIVLLCGLLLGSLFATGARAQDAEEAWKALVVQALYAAGESHFAQAEQMFLKALHEAERFGAQDSRVGTTLNSLGLVYRSEKKLSEAEVAYRRALTILEAAYGGETVDVANVRFNLATVLKEQGKAAQAMPYLEKTLDSYEALLGGASGKTASVLCAMGDSYRLLKDFSHAVASLKRCADIREAEDGVRNPELAEALHSLASTYAAQGKYALAESNFKLSEKITENTGGIFSPILAGTVDDHILLLRQIGGREQDIARYTKLASSIRRLQAQSQTKSQQNKN